MYIKNLFKFILIISIIFLYSSVCYADSTEVSINETYKKLCWLLKENTNEAYAIKSLDYGVEILTKAPESLDAFLTIFITQDIYNKCRYKTIKKVYDRLKEKHLPHLEEPDFEPGEKLIFLFTYINETGLMSKKECDDTQQKIVDILISMKDKCSDKKYAALANTMLIIVRKKDKRIEFIKNFLDNFPDHPGIPTVKLLNLSYLYEEPKKRLEEINKLMNQYGNIKMPNGWNFSADCYEEIVQCYIELKDYDSAIKYYGLIKIEAPNSWNLNEMKKYIDYIDPKNPDKANMEEENK